MKNNVFHLQIVPIKDVLPHEEYDQNRAKPLITRLKQEKHLVNPIIVATLDNGKFLQLDGMNRFSAFKMMKIPTILAQIIDYNDQDVVELSSWTHLFHIEHEKFFLCATDMQMTVKKGNIDNVGHRYIREEGQSRLCTVVTRKKEVYLIYTNGTLFDKINKLNKLVDCYKDRIFRDVLVQTPGVGDIELLFQERSSANMMMIFPTFTRHQIVDVVKHGQLFPSGVTRHIIKRRCLNVRMPMSFFENGGSLKQQNIELEKMLTNKAFRLYEEPTIYFE